jgi:hypothetical protein
MQVLFLSLHKVPRKSVYTSLRSAAGGERKSQLPFGFSFPANKKGGRQNQWLRLSVYMVLKKDEAGYFRKETKNLRLRIICHVSADTLECYSSSKLQPSNYSIRTDGRSRHARRD